MKRSSASPFTMTAVHDSKACTAAENASLRDQLARQAAATEELAKGLRRGQEELCELIAAFCASVDKIDEGTAASAADVQRSSRHILLYMSFLSRTAAIMEAQAEAASAACGQTTCRQPAELASSEKMARLEHEVAALRQALREAEASAAVASTLARRAVPASPRPAVALQWLAQLSPRRPWRLGGALADAAANAEPVTPREGSDLPAGIPKIRLSAVTTAEAAITAEGVTPRSPTPLLPGGEKRRLSFLSRILVP